MTVSICLIVFTPHRRLLRVILHSVRVSSMEVETCDCRRCVNVQFPGHTVQVGQPDMNTAHRQHTGFKQVDITVVITWDLRKTYKNTMTLTLYPVGSYVAHKTLFRLIFWMWCSIPHTHIHTFPSTAIGGWYSSVCHSPNRARSFSSFSSDVILALRERLEKPFTI